VHYLPTITLVRDVNKTNNVRRKLSRSQPRPPIYSPSPIPATVENFPNLLSYRSPRTIPAEIHEYQILTKILYFSVKIVTVICRYFFIFFFFRKKSKCLHLCFLKIKKTTHNASITKK
jgi:hypothetical protein